MKFNRLTSGTSLFFRQRHGRWTGHRIPNRPSSGRGLIEDRLRLCGIQKLNITINKQDIHSIGMIGERLIEKHGVIWGISGEAFANVNVGDEFLLSQRGEQGGSGTLRLMTVFSCWTYKGISRELLRNCKAINVVREAAIVIIGFHNRRHAKLPHVTKAFNPGRSFVVVLIEIPEDRGGSEKERDYGANDHGES